MAKIKAIELRQKMSKEMAEVKKEVVERMQNTRDGGYNYKGYNKNKGRER